MPKEILQKTLTAARVLPDLAGILPPGMQCWLVGGALRDGLLGIEPIDFDFVLSVDPTPVAKEFARVLKGTWFSLDASRNQSRVVSGPRGRRITCDFAPLRAANLERDLELRDFTINSLVLSIRPEGCGAFRDFMGGKKDLEKRLLRVCSPRSMADDPLRVLKGVRHCIEIGLEIDAASRQAMVAASKDLHAVAPERKGFEVGRILDDSSPVKNLGLLVSVEGERALFEDPLAGRAKIEAENLLRRSESLHARVVQTAGESGIHIDFHRVVEGNWTLLGLIHLGLMGKVGSNADANDLGGRLALGKKSRGILERLFRFTPETWSELQKVASRRRSRALWLAEFALPPEAALLFMGVLSRASDNAFATTVVRLVSDYRRENASGKMPDLVDGARVMKELRCGDGPKVGRALAEIRKAEIKGRITTTAQALEYLRKTADERD